MTMVLTFAHPPRRVANRTGGVPFVTHLAEQLYFTLRPVGIRIRMHCGPEVDAVDAVELVVDFLGNVENPCEACRVAWAKKLPHSDKVQVAADILLERGVALDEDMLRLLMGKPKEEPGALEELATRVLSLEMEMHKGLRWLEQRMSEKLSAEVVRLDSTGYVGSLIANTTNTNTPVRLANGTRVRTRLDKTSTHWTEGSRRHRLDDVLGVVVSGQGDGWNAYAYVVRHTGWFVASRFGAYEASELVVVDAR